MAASNPLTEQDLKQALSTLEGWTHEGGYLKKTFEFADFPAAVGFITRLAFYAEKMNHHPELRNVYSTVELALTTHEAGDEVTHMDVELAKKIEEIGQPG